MATSDDDKDSHNHFRPGPRPTTVHWFSYHPTTENYLGRRKDHFSLDFKSEQGKIGIGRGQKACYSAPQDSCIVHESVVKPKVKILFKLKIDKILHLDV